MNDKVPFTRIRWAIFVTMCTTIAATAAANHLARGQREDGLVDVGLCIMGSCTLLGLLLVFRSQRLMNRDNTWRLRRCETGINDHERRIAGFDAAIMQAYFPDGAPLHVVAETDPPAASGLPRGAEVLPMSPREFPR